MSLTKEEITHWRKRFLKSGVFRDHNLLHSLFKDERIAPWQAHLPLHTANEITLIDTCIDQWHDRDNNGRTILDLFNEVLTEWEKSHPFHFITKPTAPRPTPHFVGRETVRASLRQRLQSGGAVQAIVAVQGMGGIGKTELAKQLAWEMANFFTGGVFWADMTAVNGDPFPILGSWGSQCGQEMSQLPNTPARISTVRSLLQRWQGEHGPILAVVDDLRPMWKDGAASLQEAIPAGVPLLLTTREAALAQRLGARVTPLDLLTEAEAVQLLGELTEGALAGEAAQQVAGWCGYLPLALTLAGAVAAVEGVEWLVKRLGDGAKRLATLQADEATLKQESVRLTFDLSYGRLVGEGATGELVQLAKLFRWLSIFAIGQTQAELIARVWQKAHPTPTSRLELLFSGTISPEKGEEIEGQLRQLRRLALVTGEGQGYGLHPLLRLYAQEKLQEAGERETAEQAHTAAMLTFAKAHAQATPEDYDALETAQENLLLAMDRAYKQRAWQTVRDMAFALQSYLRVRGYWAELKKREGQGLAAAQALGNQRDVAGFAHNLGTVAHLTGAYGEARGLYQESLEIKRALGNRAGIAASLGQLANLAQDEGNISEAEALYRQGMSLSQEVGDIVTMSKFQFKLALLLEEQNRLSEALPLLQSAVAIAERVGLPSAAKDRQLLARVQQKMS